jgi:hypothetical protein
MLIDEVYDAMGKLITTYLHLLSIFDEAHYLYMLSMVL